MFNLDCWHRDNHRDIEMIKGNWVLLMNRQNRIAERFDWNLSLLLFLFFIISCVAIYSGQSTSQYNVNFALAQVKNYVAGTVILAIVMYFDTEQVKKLAWYLFGFGFILQAGLFVAPEWLAEERKGATLWYQIKFLGSVQPSEFFKIFLIIALAKVTVGHHKKFVAKTFQTDLLLLLKIGGLTFIPFALIVVEDLGTALVILAIMTGIILVSGITWKLILPIITLGSAAVAGILYLVIQAPQYLEKYVDTYQMYRIYAWLDPVGHRQGDGLQLYNSLHAIGSGLLSGKGFYDRQVYIPDVHTDFIFSVIGEEYGFIGASIVIGLFFLLIYHLTKTALEAADPFNTYICVGIIGMITFHVFQNIGMTIQVLPITGIPLPFISYGGSSIMGNMMAMGLVFGMKFHQKNYMFSSGKNYVD